MWLGEEICWSDQDVKMCKNSFPSSNAMQCNVNFFLPLWIITATGSRSKTRGEGRRQREEGREKTGGKKRRTKRRSKIRGTKRRSKIRGAKRRSKARRTERGSKARRTKRGRKTWREKGGSYFMKYGMCRLFICVQYKISPCDLWSCFGRGDEN